MRVCDVCKTPLPGPKGHGWVRADGRVVCGRTSVLRGPAGGNLRSVKTPGCAR